jgi:hypothetical protein
VLKVQAHASRVRLVPTPSKGTPVMSTSAKPSKLVLSKDHLKALHVRSDVRTGIVVSSHPCIPTAATCPKPSFFIQCP